jgi:hypothetical protein
MRSVVLQGLWREDRDVFNDIIMHLLRTATAVPSQATPAITIEPEALTQGIDDFLLLVNPTLVPFQGTYTRQMLVNTLGESIVVKLQEPMWLEAITSCGGSALRCLSVGSGNDVNPKKRVVEDVGGSSDEGPTKRFRS